MSTVQGPLPGMPSLQGLSESQRNNTILTALLGGALPAYLRRYVPVRVSGGGHTGTVFVSPDWVGFGDPEGQRRYRVALPAPMAQRVADAYGAVLPTPKIVRAIHQQGQTRVPMHGMRTWSQQHGVSMNSTATWDEFNRQFEQARAGRGGLVTDGAKDIVVSYAQSRHPDKLAIVGGWTSSDPNADPVQGYQLPHAKNYGDYSQLLRLVGATMNVDGMGSRPVADVLADPVLFRLLLDDQEFTTPTRPIARGLARYT